MWKKVAVGKFSLFFFDLSSEKSKFRLMKILSESENSIFVSKIVKQTFTLRVIFENIYRNFFGLLANLTNRQSEEICQKIENGRALNSKFSRKKMSNKSRVIYRYFQLSHV